MRVFVAFPIDDINAQKINAVIYQNEKLDGINWTPVENLHLTLFFIGEVDEATIPEILVAMENVCRQLKSFTLSFDRFTTKGKPTKPTMVWSSYEKNESFSQANKLFENAFQFLKMNQSAYKDPIPHCTLGRIKSKEEATKIDFPLSNLPEKMQVHSAGLWQSTGTIYKRIKNFEFTLQ